MVRVGRRENDFHNKKHECFREKLDFTLLEHRNSSKQCGEMLSKLYLISAKVFDNCLKEWLNCGEPDSFNVQTNLNIGKVNRKVARNHRRDVQEINSLVNAGFDPTGLRLGTGLPNPWSSYGHYLYLHYFPVEFAEACKLPEKGVKRCLDVEFEEELLVDSYRSDICPSTSGDSPVSGISGSSEQNINYPDVLDISLPEGGILEIPSDKYLGQEDKVVTIADVALFKLKKTPILASWRQDSMDEPSTSSGITANPNTFQHLTMGVDLDEILEWDTPDIIGQEEVASDNYTTDDLRVLFQVQNTAEIETQTVITRFMSAGTQTYLEILTEVEKVQAREHSDKRVVLTQKSSLVRRQTEVASTQTQLELLQIDEIKDTTIQQLNMTFETRLKWISKLKDIYPESVNLDKSFIDKVKMITPEVAPSYIFLEDVKHWAIPIMFNLSGAFGIIVCPCAVITSPLDIFQVFQEFSPCILLIHENFQCVEPQNVIMPMQVCDYSS